MGRRAAFGLGGRGDRELIRLRSTGQNAESVRYTDRSYGPIAQLVERMAGSHEVRGSNPLGSTACAMLAFAIAERDDGR
jgi:hypothetical protein